MSSFDIEKLFEEPQGNFGETEAGFVSVSEAMKSLKKQQIRDIIGPQRPFHQLIEFLGGEVTLRYGVRNEKIVDTSLEYSIPKSQLDKLIGYIGTEHLPKEGDCLIFADFGNNLDILIYEKSEEIGKDLVNTQGENENIFFISRNYHNGFKSGNS